MPVAAAREALREGFTRWGLPGLLRVDNGHPWGSKGDLPTDLALWLIGLGVGLWWNPPRRPQDNGVVERSQGTGKRWGEPHTCDGAAVLQARLDRLDDLQRRIYPYKGRKSRMECHAGLGHSGRAYAAGGEAAAWRWERVAEHLAGYCVTRQVDQKGQVSIYNRNHYVGVSHRGRRVYVTFNGAGCQWAVADEGGRVFKEVAAEELLPGRILALEVTHRRSDAGPPADQPGKPRLDGKT